MAASPGRRGWVTPALVVLFLGLPILEVFLLVKVGELIGVLPTVGLLIVTAVLGTWLMRREGTKAWRSLRDAFGEGKVPSRELSDGALVLAGGLLLTLPGFVTDVVGLVCLLPFTRPVPRRLLGWFTGRQVDKAGLGGLGTGFSTGITRMRGDVIPGEVVDDPTDTSGPKSSGPKSSRQGTTPDDSGRAIEGRILD